MKQSLLKTGEGGRKHRYEQSSWKLDEGTEKQWARGTQRDGWAWMRTHLRRFCSRDTGTARRCPNRWIPPPRTAGSRSCWPTSPAAGASPLPHPRAVSPGSCRGKVWGCPCGNLSSTEAFPLLPYFCFLHRKRTKEKQEGFIKRSFPAELSNAARTV